MFIDGNDLPFVEEGGEVAGLLGESGDALARQRFFGRNLGQADAAGRQRILELACRPASSPGFVDIAGCLAKLPCIIRLRCLKIDVAAARGGLVLGLRGAFRALTAFLGAACGFFSLDRRLDYAIVSSTACSITIEDRRWWFRNAGSGIREFALCLRVPPHFAQDLVSTARSQLILFRLPLIFECPLGAPLCLQRLRLLSARQLRAVRSANRIRVSSRVWPLSFLLSA